MIQATFQHRSGRVIALGRLVLAAVFLLAVWLDPSQPSQNPDLAYPVLASYVIWAAGLLALTWSNWWLDHRLSASAHLVDIVAFGTLVFFTEGYTSPFYTFFVFLLLSSAIRWSWRETALTAGAVAVLFFAAGTAALAIDSAEFDLQRLLIRLTHLIVLSLLFIWFGVNQHSGMNEARSAELELPPEAEGPPIRLAMQHAADRTKAKRVVFAWWQREEPWIHVAQLDESSFGSDRVGPDHYTCFFAEEARGSAFLFDRKRERAVCLVASGSHRLRGFSQTVDPEFARRYRVDHGLAIRIRGEEYEGELLALEIDGLCTDDLRIGQRLAAEISALFDRSSRIAGSEEAALTRARMSLGRDLHDSVVQVLAGAAFRLEALKSWIKAGRDPEPEIESVKADLTAEQRNIRSFIAALRSGRSSMQHTDLSAGLPDLIQQIERRWNLACDLSRPRGEIVAPIWVEHELHQIIREAAANAARHGRATALHVALKDGNGDIELSITDNGIGFPSAGSAGNGNATSPWTVHERVKGLGGTLSLFSGGGGSRLQIRVPVDSGQ
ncbi:MAG TPA: ATP-binding protein [Allosphingosinicella sp.]|nr:ATP-binding protein [Allosphingosinicella sp.]